MRHPATVALLWPERGANSRELHPCKLCKRCNTRTRTPPTVPTALGASGVHTWCNAYCNQRACALTRAPGMFTIVYSCCLYEFLAGSRVWGARLGSNPEEYAKNHVHTHLFLCRSSRRNAASIAPLRPLLLSVVSGLIYSTLHLLS